MPHVYYPMYLIHINMCPDFVSYTKSHARIVYVVVARYINSMLKFRTLNIHLAHHIQLNVKAYTVFRYGPSTLEFSQANERTFLKGKIKLHVNKPQLH